MSKNCHTGGPGPGPGPRPGPDPEAETQQLLGPQFVHSCEEDEQDSAQRDVRRRTYGCEDLDEDESVSFRLFVGKSVLTPQSLPGVINRTVMEKDHVIMEEEAEV